MLAPVISSLDEIYCTVNEISLTLPPQFDPSKARRPIVVGEESSANRRVEGASSPRKQRRLFGFGASPNPGGRGPTSGGVQEAALSLGKTLW